MDIILKNIKKTYKKNIIFDINCIIYEKKINLIIANNGFGKTSLLKIIAGLDNNYIGKVYNNKNVCFMFQENRLLENYNIYNNINFIYNHKINIELINNKLEEIGLDVSLGEKVSELNFAKKRMLNILICFLFDNRLIMLDEPFYGLDVGKLKKVKDYIINNKKNNTVLITACNNDNDDIADNIIKF